MISYNMNTCKIVSHANVIFSELQEPRVVSPQKVVISKIHRKMKTIIDITLESQISPAKRSEIKAQVMI